MGILRTALGRLRVTGILEGVSYLLLLFVAMPLKYGLGLPEAVFWTGSAHGGLFILYCVFLVETTLARRWGLRKVAIAFAAALVPFGTFWLEARLRREAMEEEAGDSGALAGG